MNERLCKGRTVLSLALTAAMMLTGCATIRGSDARSTEQLLAAAGFVMRPADTAERQQRLAARPPYRLESHTKDGMVVYTYADPDGCKCLYVGGPKEYSEISTCGSSVRSPRMRRGRPTWPIWTGTCGARSCGDQRRMTTSTSPGNRESGTVRRS